MNGKNFSVIHTQALIMLKYIEIYLKLPFLNLLKDMIYRYAEQIVTDCNGDYGWCEVAERTSGVTDTLLQEPDMTENVES